MLIGLFKNRHPFSYLLLLGYCFLVFAILYVKQDIYIQKDSSLLLSTFEINIGSFSSKWLVTISIISAFTFSLLLQGILKKFAVFTDQSLLPSYIFITLCGIYPEMIILSPASVCIFITLLVINNLCLASDQDNSVQILFFTAFVIALGSMIYSPVAFHIVLLILLLPFIKTIRGRELLILPVGFIVPFYLAGFYFYYTDNLQGYVNLILQNIPRFTLPIASQNILYGIPSGLISLIFLFSYVRYRFQMRSKTIRLIIYNRIILNYAVFSTLMFVFLASHKWTMGYYVLAAFTPFISNMLADENFQRLNQIIFTVLIGFIGVYQWILISY